MGNKSMTQTAFEMMKASAHKALPIQSTQLAELPLSTRQQLLQGLQAYIGSESEALETYLTAFSAGRTDAYLLLKDLSEAQLLPLHEAIQRYREQALSEEAIVAPKILFNLIEGHCFYYYVSE